MKGPPVNRPCEWTPDIDTQPRVTELDVDLRVSAVEVSSAGHKMKIRVTHFPGIEPSDILAPTLIKDL